MTPVDAALIFALAFGASVVQAATGLGFGLLIVPPLVLVIGVKDAVVVSNVLSTALSVLVVSRVHAAVDWRATSVLAIASLAGMPIGLAVLIIADPTLLQVVIAGAVIVFTVLLARQVALPVHGRAGEGVAGFVSGVLRTSTSMSGPPVIILLQGRGMESARFRATITAYFVCGGIVSVALFALARRIDGQVLAETGVALPAVVLGAFAGAAVYRRANERTFRRGVLAILLFSAAVALVTAFV